MPVKVISNSDSELLDYDWSGFRCWHNDDDPSLVRLLNMKGFQNKLLLTAVNNIDVQEEGLGVDF